MYRSTAVIAGCIKNAEKFLENVLQNISSIAEHYDEVAYIFVENDSTDKSKDILKKWGSKQENFHLINFDGLDAYEKNRTIRLEIARNAYIYFLLNDPKLISFDELIVMDMDDRGCFPIDHSQFISARTFLNSKNEIAGLFANQLNSYYDLWALRHKEFCPFDFWHKVLENSLSGLSDEEAFNLVKIIVPDFFSAELKPILVDSAFGGLAIYKIKYIRTNKSRYIGHLFKFFGTNESNIFFSKLQTCEHVSFNQGITEQGGELYIFPSLINSNEITSFIPSSFRTLLI